MCESRSGNISGGNEENIDFCCRQGGEYVEAHATSIVSRCWSQVVRILDNESDIHWPQRYFIFRLKSAFEAEYEYSWSQQAN